MIKEKLKQALKVAVDDYNGGTGVNAAIAKAAEAADFNEHQTERLVEMFNTLAALNQEKSASDPTGSCELADKQAVAKLMVGDGLAKTASSPAFDASSYDFYTTSPEKTNGIINARGRGMAKVAADMAQVSAVPEELNVSERCLFDMISDRIDLLKSAGAAADEIVRQSQLEAERCAVKIAKTIEHPFADVELADLFKAACTSDKAVSLVSEYSTKVAESKGGRFASMNVFDTSKVDDLLKVAGELDGFLLQIPEYKSKRDFYHAKAAEFEESVRGILGLSVVEKKASVADLFTGGVAMQTLADSAKAAKANDEVNADGSAEDAAMSVKVAELIRKSGISADEVGRLAADLEKDAAPKMLMTMPSINESYDALVRTPGIDNERQIILNTRRSIILADLMANDPIIRDADPETVVEAYKTMVMSSPRVSLDKAQVRSWLRTAANSVAISPADAKLISDVDKGVAFANVDRLTARDSSIKDSNKA